MRFSKLVLPGIAMIAVTYGLARYSFGLFLPRISESLNMSESVSGIISSLFYLSYCFTVVLSTVITTREGPRRMIMVAGLFAFVGLVLIGVTPNIWILAFGVLLAGGSTGFISPPYGAAISLWIQEKQQGRANTWINSGTSLGIILSGIGAIFLAANWRQTYIIYAILTLIILAWNYRIIPRNGMSSKLMFERGTLSLKGAKGASSLVFVSLILGISTAHYWTFSRSFIEISATYTDIQLSVFWIVIGLFGVLGGFSGSLIEKTGLSLTYKCGSLAIASASIILALAPGNLFVSYLSAGIFGSSYIFITGVLLVWGIKVFISNASLGIAVPFLLLAVGQVIGSFIAGIFIETWGYVFSFMFYGLVGMFAAFIGPKEQEKNN